MHRELWAVGGAGRWRVGGGMEDWEDTQLVPSVVQADGGGWEWARPHSEKLWSCLEMEVKCDVSIWVGVGEASKNNHLGVLGP